MTSRRSHTFEAQQRASERKEPKIQQPIPKPAKRSVTLSYVSTNQNIIGRVQVSVAKEPWSKE